MHKVTSVQGIPVRLTDERWSHIVEEHCEVAGILCEVLDAVACPERVMAGGVGECLAVKAISPEKSLVVVYKEDKELQDGFIITAFLTKRLRSLDRRPQLWP